MTYQNICGFAFTLLGETVDGRGLDDYSSRAATLLAGITAELSLHSELLGGGSFTPTAEVRLTDDFPLSDKLAYTAAAKLAARLIFDESPELASALDTYAAASLELSCRSASEVGQVREVYQ